MRRVYFRGRGAAKILHEAQNCPSFWCVQIREPAPTTLPHPVYTREARRLFAAGWRFCKRCSNMK